MFCALCFATLKNEILIPHENSYIQKMLFSWGWFSEKFPEPPNFMDAKNIHLSPQKDLEIFIMELCKDHVMVIHFCVKFKKSFLKMLDDAMLQLNPQDPFDLEYNLKVLLKILIAKACRKYYHESRFSGLVKSVYFDEFLYKLRYGLCGTAVQVSLVFNAIF